MSESSQPSSPLPPKDDHETLVLRGKPRPAARFRRGLIVGVTGVAAVSLVTRSWFALQPPSFRKAGAPVASGDEQDASPDALANAPKTYGDVPRLGPPLPGDLGRPILAHERSLAGPLSPFPGTGEPSSAQTAAELGRERAAAAREGARTAGLMVQLGSGEQAPVMSASVIPSDPSARSPAAEAAAVPASQQHKIEFAAAGAGAAGSRQLVSAPSGWMLSAGTVIPASLITGLNSDLPGMVLAQVTQNVRDSATGRAIFVPQGARLIGKYDSVVAYGQRRALLIWSRIVFPDGSSVELDHMPATDVRVFGSHGRRGLSHLAAAERDRHVDAARRWNPAELWRQRERSRARAPRIRAGERGARWRSDDFAQSRHPADDHCPSWLAGSSVAQQGPHPGAVEGLMMDLRLAKLPDRMPVRRTVSISPGLNQALREHAALYAQTYGSDEPAAELIPAMLGAFLDGDQAFARWRRGAGKRDG